MSPAIESRAGDIASERPRKPWLRWIILSLITAINAAIWLGMATLLYGDDNTPSESTSATENSVMWAVSVIVLGGFPSSAMFVAPARRLLFGAINSIMPLLAVVVLYPRYRHTADISVVFVIASLFSALSFLFGFCPMALAQRRQRLAREADRRREQEMFDQTRLANEGVWPPPPTA